MGSSACVVAGLWFGPQRQAGGLDRSAILLGDQAPAAEEATAPPIQTIRKQRTVAPTTSLALAGARAGLRLAEASERTAIRSEIDAQHSLFAREVTGLSADARQQAEPSTALLLARERVLRLEAVRVEVSEGRVWARDREVPLATIQDAEARGEEVVLVDAGDVRSVVFLDPARHRRWAEGRAQAEAIRQKQARERTDATLSEETRRTLARMQKDGVR